MITQSTRIDYERIGEIDIPSVSTVLQKTYGADLCDANVEELLALLEVLAFSLRTDENFCDSLRNTLVDGPAMPCGIYTFARVGRNEGLKLIAMLQVAIVERYSVEAFKVC